MKVTFDPKKREATLDARGLDFKDAELAFKGLHFTRRDDRFAYGEQRFISVGQLDSRSLLWFGLRVGIRAALSR